MTDAMMEGARGMAAATEEEIALFVSDGRTADLEATLADLKLAARTFASHVEALKRIIAYRRQRTMN
jgi:hypothetical protein